MTHSTSEKGNVAASHPTQTHGVLDPTVIAESSSRIIQQSRQALAPKIHYSLLTSDSTRPQLFDANGRPTHLTSRASYKYHNGKLSVKRQRTHPATETEPSAAPTNSELLAIAHNDDSDTDAPGEEDWEVCDQDFTASPALQLSSRRSELTGVRRSIPFFASLSVSRKPSPPTPSTRLPMPEMQQTSEPTASPTPPEAATLTSEPQAAIIDPAPRLPTLLPATQESELTELSESEGHLHDYRLVPQRHAAAVAEARVSVQAKKGAIKRAATPAKALHDQKVRPVRGNWTLEEEIALVRFVLEGAGKFEWDEKAPQLAKRLPLGRSLDDAKARWSTLLSYLNGPSAQPNIAITTWSLDEDQKILSIVIDCTQTYARALVYGKQKNHETRSPSAFGSKWNKLKSSQLAAWFRKAAGGPNGCSEDITAQPPALLKPENSSSEDEAAKKKPSTGKRKRDPIEDEEVETKASKKSLRSDDVVKWTAAEDKQLLQAIAKYAQVDWNLVRTELLGLQPSTPSKTPQTLEKRWNILKTSLSVGKQRLSGITESERWPKTTSEWALPVAATVATGVALGYIFRPSEGYSGDRPPTVPSWIPWVGSSWEIESDPDAFFRQAEKDFPGGIIGVHSAGHKFYFVTSSALINQIYKQPKVYTLSPVQMGWAKAVFSLSDHALFGSPVFPERLAPHMDRSIAPKNMMSLTKSFENHLRQEVQTRALPSQSVSLQDFVIKLSYIATGAAYFGPTFNAMGTWDAFKGFDEMVYKVALGYPSSLLRNFARCREEMINKFIAYLDKPHDASELIRGQEEIIRDVPFDKRDMGCMMLCAWWPLMANVPWGTLWVLLNQLQRPEGVQPLIDELNAAGKAWSASHPEFIGPYTLHLTEFFQSNPPLPLLSSTISESLRYATDSYSMRSVVPEEVQLGPYTIKKGETLICSTRSVHMDENEFENAREYVPTRFVSDDGGAKGTEGSFKWMPFGGGVSICSGRHFANYHVKIFLATLLTNFKCRLDVDKSQLPITVGNINRGFGLRRPKGDLYVSINRA
ncbi:Cytochrome P450 7B1 [Tulasnella sp. UAMH 9824]|nr:Cytochrome P450 7B1 [Tulasnella sp. UAMH 9824]